MANSNEKYPKVVTPKFRVSYPSLVEPSSYDESQPKKFSVVALFEKGTDMTVLYDMAKATAKAAWGDNVPANVRSPFMDGSTKDKPGYADAIYCNFKSKERPQIVDHNRNPLLDPSEVYGGCYARGTVTCYAYGAGTRIQGNKPPGISFGLQNLQKMGEGEPFSSRSNAEDDFDAVEPIGDADTAGGGDPFPGSGSNPQATEGDVDKMFG